MDHKHYLTHIYEGNFPKDTKVELPEGYSDARGDIQNIWEGISGSITIITSKKGSVRSNHKHDSWHSIYILEGSCNYYETDNKDDFGEPRIFKKGEMVFSRPDIWHRVEMLEDTVFVVVNSILKNTENHEKTVSRI